MIRPPLVRRLNVREFDGENSFLSPCPEQAPPPQPRPDRSPDSRRQQARKDVAGAGVESQKGDVCSAVREDSISPNVRMNAPSAPVRNVHHSPPLRNR